MSESVAIIGAGVVGLSCALEAQRQGLQVTLFDRDAPGLGASFGNAGYLAVELIEPLSNPRTLRAALSLWLNPKSPLALPVRYLHRIAPWLIKFMLAAMPQPLQRSRRALLHLNRASIEAWQRSLEDIGAREQMVKSGYLLVWESVRGIDAALQHQAWLRQHGIDTELVQGARLLELEPALAGQVQHALFFPEAYRVRDPQTLCQHLFTAFIERGGQFIQQRVTQLTPSVNDISVTTADDAYCYDHTLICSGAWSRALLNQVGIDVPLEAERGYHLTLPRAGSLLRHHVGSAERQFVMGPLDCGLRIVGMSELGGLTLPPIKRRFELLRHHSRQLLPTLNQETLAQSEWMGYRPTLPDSLPVIDQHPDYPRLCFAFGHQHLGVTQAAITAELMIQLMQQRQTTLDMSAFSVTRF
ncbi:FAD-binding oxidoreductase [Amphritea sp. 1_MG-2023]|uniref:NAD(P)/FAD-dependent oxidoreductase n=1 Tax=Amphritea sp. 1_MG-2023 TaxID=3062670 RepID=UPI0026E48678|nr:FAD-binding oxidoreductase [Amphritea sp. 1_MG-2023]MDO6564479.1 FAD-binding oxidoreductase [Amphritea sp. 1_MG-2023]